MRKPEPKYMSPADLFDLISDQDRVTIRVHAGIGRNGAEFTEVTGRAVGILKGPSYCTLNMGGRHGTPGVASKDNIVQVVKKGERTPYRNIEIP